MQKCITALSKQTWSALNLSSVLLIILLFYAQKTSSKKTSSVGEYAKGYDPITQVLFPAHYSSFICETDMTSNCVTVYTGSGIAIFTVKGLFIGGYE